jgi:hypothetical protein
LGFDPGRDRPDLVVAMNTYKVDWNDKKDKDGSALEAVTFLMGKIDEWIAEWELIEPQPSRTKR